MIRAQLCLKRVIKINPLPHLNWTATWTGHSAGLWIIPAVRSHLFHTRSSPLPPMFEDQDCQNVLCLSTPTLPLTCADTGWIKMCDAVTGDKTFLAYNECLGLGASRCWRWVQSFNWTPILTLKETLYKCLPTPPRRPWAFRTRMSVIHLCE